MDNTSPPQPDPLAVITGAVGRAADLLGLSAAQSAAILGATEAIQSPGNPREPALLFLEAFRHLDVLFGGNIEQCRRWLHAPNDHLGGIPVELMASIPGLVRVNDYLSRMRQPS
jgi:hypothetical protein